MGLSLLGEVARTAVITMYAAAFACIVSGAFAVPMSMSPGQPAEAAIRISKLMALLGGVAALTFGISGMAYFWLTGVASRHAFILIEMALVGGAVVFAIAVAVIHAKHPARPG